MNKAVKVARDRYLKETEYRDFLKYWLRAERQWTWHHWLYRQYCFVRNWESTEDCQEGMYYTVWASVDPGGFWGDVTPLLSTTKFFCQRTCELWQKNFARNFSRYSMDAIYLNLWSQNRLARCQTSTCLTQQLNIILRQNCTVRIGRKSHLRASRFKNFPGGPDPRSGAHGC
jgi:hypothetical protein